MPYTPPAPKDIKARFPEFTNVADTAIEHVLQVAKRSVDGSWVDGDYSLAIQYLTAHMLAAGGATASDPILASALGPLVSESLGDASRSFANRAELTGFTGLSAELATTTYGTQFLRLRRMNHPAIALC